MVTCQCCYCQDRPTKCEGCTTGSASWTIADCLLAGVGAQASGAQDEGRKNDSFGQPGQKARWDLAPWACLNEVVEVLTHGATKYGDGNYMQVENHVPRYFSAAMRHLVKWMTGEKIDPESGKSHLAHAVASILFLMARDQ